MKQRNPGILAINGGSSSIKFAVYENTAALPLRIYGEIVNIGQSGTHLSFNDDGSKPDRTLSLAHTDDAAAVDFLFNWLAKQPEFADVKLVGQRVVHGMQRTEPAWVTASLLAELKGIISFAPQHLPHEIGLMETLALRYPSLPQLACFDTAFHHDMPNVAKWLAIPRRYQALGVQRYGFQGLSYSYLLNALGQLGDPAATQGRVILAHLGSSTSLAAVLNGHSIDTSMGFTPASGVMMSTCSGDLDPGVMTYLAHSEKISIAQFNQMINCESGLLGVSELSPDIRDLLADQATDERAAEAVALYCYQVKKCIGGLAAALGGLDTLVFSGGIGTNEAQIRAGICQGLAFLGIELDYARNSRSAALLSAEQSRVRVRVIAADPTLSIARAVRRCT